MGRKKWEHGNLGKRKETVIMGHFFLLHLCTRSLHKIFHLITVAVLKDLRYLAKVSKALTSKAVMPTLALEPGTQADIL